MLQGFSIYLAFSGSTRVSDEDKFFVIEPQPDHPSHRVHLDPLGHLVDRHVPGYFRLDGAHVQHWILLSVL